MKIVYNWLKEFVDAMAPAAELMVSEAAPEARPFGIWKLIWLAEA